MEKTYKHITFALNFSTCQTANNYFLSLYNTETGDTNNDTLFFEKIKKFKIQV